MNSKRKRGRPAVHPWRRWIGSEAGHTFVLVKGRDFSGTCRGMGVQLRTKAKELGWLVSVQIEGAVIILTNRGRDDAED